MDSSQLQPTAQGHRQETPNRNSTYSHQTLANSTNALSDCTESVDLKNMVDRSQSSSRDGKEVVKSDDSETEKGGESQTQVATGPLDWDGPDDVDNPWNWSPAKRWYGTIVPGLLCLLVFVYPCLSR
jgi:hypothetical protein